MPSSKKLTLSLVALAIIVVGILAFINYQSKGEDLSGTIKLPAKNAAVASLLDVTLSKKSLSKTVTAGSLDETLIAFDFKATNGPVELKNLTLTRTYLGEVKPGKTEGSYLLVENTGNVLTPYKKSFDQLGKLTFTDLKLKINKNETKTVWVEGDIYDTDLDKAYTFAIDIQSKDDIVAKNASEFPGGVIKNPQVIINDGDGPANLRDQFDSPNKQSVIKITVNPTPSEGKVTLALIYLPDTTVYVNSQRQTFMKLRVTSESDIQVNQVQLKLKGLVLSTDPSGAGGLINKTTGQANLTKIRLFDSATGSGVMGPVDLDNSGSDTDQILSLQSPQWQVKAGTSKEIAVTVDIQNNPALNGEQFSVSLLHSPVIVYTKSNKSVTDIIPGVDINGQAITIKATTLSLSLDPNTPSQTVVKNTRGKPLVGFIFEANQDVTINSLTTTCYLDENGDGNFSAGTENNIAITEPLSSLSLFENSLADSNKIGDTKTPSASTGKSTFSNLSLLIEADQPKTLIVGADFNQHNGLTPDWVGCDIAATADLIAQDSNGNSINLTAAAPNNTNKPKVTTQLISSGNLTISETKNPPPSQTVPGGTTNVITARFGTFAQYEKFQIEKMTLKLNNPASSRSIQKVTVKFPTKFDNSSNLDGQAQATALKPGTTDRYEFTNMNFAIPQEKSEVQFEVYVDVSGVGPGQAGVSGDVIQLTFDGDSVSSFKAVGDSSYYTKTEADVDSITSPTKITVQ